MTKTVEKPQLLLKHAHVHESGQRFHESGQRGSVMTGRAFAAFLRAVPRDGSQDRRLTVAAF